MRERVSVMILPVGLDCNMACRYCYHSGKDCWRRRSMEMSDEVLRRTIVGASRLSRNIDFLWHGGEPLLIGLDHFMKAAQIEKEIRFLGRVRNMIQTNGILLNQQMCEFFAKEGFSVSTSLDGPKEINDTNRCFASGSGTYSRVLKVIQRWHATGNKIGAVTLVTKTNASRPLETYEGLKSSGLNSCAFHFCSQNENGSVDVVPDEEEGFNFFRTVFDKWLEDDNPSFPIRNFRNIIRVMLGGRPLDCASNVGGCRGFIAVVENGDVYPCHRFAGNQEFRIGNVLETDLDEINSRASAKYDSICSLGSDCQRCKWLKMCGGGCSHERFIMNGSFRGVHPECSLKKRIFEHVEKKIAPLI